MDMMTIPLRQECPPGACDCRREILLEDPAGDRRVLMLNKQEEKRLLDRFEAVQTLADLRHMEQKLFQLLGITLRIDPGPNEVRTVPASSSRWKNRSACAARSVRPFRPPSGAAWNAIPRFPTRS